MRNRNSEYIIAYDYGHGALTGEWLRRRHTNPCTTSTADIDVAGSIPYSWWHDTISSYATFAGCRAKHFEHNGFSGATYPAAGYLGGMVSLVGTSLDDQTSSIAWT